MADEETVSLRCLTIDVEEVWHTEAARGVVAREHWDVLPVWVERGLEVLLDLCDKHEIRATLFFLGDVAKRCPGLAAGCAARGHEIACHGQNHARLHTMTPKTLAADLTQAKLRLEAEVGRPVLGYRAPCFSLTRDTEWAHDVIRSCGFVYDSSVFPASFRDDAYPDWAASSQLTMRELPALTWSVGKRHLPAAGGAYFRVFPLALMKQALRQSAAAGQTAVTYFHPWEFDTQQTRLPLSRKQRLRTYTGIDRSAARLDALLTWSKQLPGEWVTCSEAAGVIAQPIQLAA